MSSPVSRRTVLKAGIALGALAGVSLTGAPHSLATTRRQTFTSAEQVARRVFELARESVELGSRGVGGLLLDNRTGEVLREGRNYRFLPVDPAVSSTPDEVFTFDYTAHGETGIVGWYVSNRHRLRLPHPRDLTLVTSLDPCAMCTGSILTMGFNAAVVAYDPTGGMNVTEDGRYRTLTPALRAQALETIGFYGVTRERPYFGPEQIPFRRTEVSQETANDCQVVFFSPRKGTSVDNAVPLDQVVDPFSLPDADPFRIAMKQVWPEAGAVRLASPYRPSRELKDFLESLLRQNPGARNAVAFIDRFGNLLTARTDNPRRMPFGTAFMNTTQSYARNRYGLFNDPRTHEGAKLTLTSPEHGAFVWLHAPTPDIASTLKDLGAFGSTMGDQTPGGFQFYEPPVAGEYGELLEQIAFLPPFYTQRVVISPLPVGVFSSILS
jgi:tRNA(Arg) A34 adenosine deaminase TadA